MPAKRLTLASLERELREALSRARMGFRPLRNTTISAYTYPKLTPQPIVVDVFQIDILTASIHEALHRTRYAQLKAWGDLEEVVTEAVTTAISNYIRVELPRRERWRSVVDGLEAPEPGDE